ncbi:NADH-quinone oxidoreductase subunit J [Mitsuokella multacida]|uniref:NADH-quinone oxidoreductase subunit J n=1 Tax=Mitsuokella multacida TaxID=52226 RepID=UPI00241CA80A|nr:NADH-quinone oxidoreductase subunit J [Mitsuokella multacida]
MQLLFFLFALVAVIGALGMVLSRNIVHSALFLVLSFIGLALIYFALQAPFLGAVQLMVYSGAVAILIVMAIMMVGRADMSISAPVQSLVKCFVGAGMAALVFLLLGLATALTPLPVISAAPATEAADLAVLLLSNFALPFELAAVLLLAATIGALLLARGGKIS